MSTPATTAAALLTALPATTVETQPEGTGTGSTTPAWYEQASDPELKGFLSNKKFATPFELATAYRNLEGVYGADKAGRTILKPNDQVGADGKVTKRDDAGWSAFNKAIGVPEKAEDYKLPVPEGDDGAFAKTASVWMHKRGVPASAAVGLAEDWNGFIAEQVKAGEEADAMKAGTETAALRAEWGDKADANFALAQRGLNAVAKIAGLNMEAKGDIEHLQAILGAGKMTKMFQAIGHLVKESGFAGGDGGGDGGAIFSRTVESAQKELNQIQLDRTNGKITQYQWDHEFSSKGGKLDQLTAIITGEKRAA